MTITKASLVPSSPHGKSQGAVRITTPVGDKLTISFQRTIRVPDNGKTSNLPPSMGAFPLYSVADYKKTLPAEMALKGGVFLPMYQREAMWIRFASDDQFAINVSVGGVNAISGEPLVETSATQLRRLNLMSERKSVQDYVVTPQQLWLDGIASTAGRVRQFVAVPMGNGYTVEAQVTGEEVTGGLQFQVTLPKPYPSGALRLFVKTLTGGGGNKRLPEFELGVAAGGLIKQCIINDTYKADTWDRDSTIRFNVQILNSSVFRQVTGMDPPEIPALAATYASEGLPFFDIYNETSDIQGNFEDVKSVK
ncbi:MAG: hypothetical protein Q9228_001892 [Teloschistes exilis]